MKEASSFDHRPVWMEGSDIFLIDQRLLPHKQSVLRASSTTEVVAALRDMAVRGAGTIGVTAGFAIAQAALKAPPTGFWQEISCAVQQVNAARPTAKNLSHAVERVYSSMRMEAEIERARRRAVSEAQAFYEENVRMTEQIGRAAVALIPETSAVLTHCNAGWLACTGWGTALAPIYMAHQQGRQVFVIATETRPRGQGARLTSWELAQAGVPHALIADTAAGSTMAKGEIGMVIVGADRIAANGDTANKIGTYTLAVLAKAHEIPFYVAAPSPTFDADCPSGGEIPIEERDEAELLEVTGASATGEWTSVRVAAPGVRAKNPAFDVTPASLITGFITESGIVQPSREAIARFLATTTRGRSPATLQPS